MLGISRRVWILSGIVFLLMLVFWLFLPPVIIDTFARLYGPGAGEQVAADEAKFLDRS
jgi:hypothetical protein